MNVLGIGDNVCDKYLHTKTIYPGGNALNVAVFSSFLGANAAYLGTFGDDLIGRHVYSVATQLNLDLSHCRFEHGENGLARVRLVDGDRIFLPGNRGGICRKKPPRLTEQDAVYLQGFDLVHTSVFSEMEDGLPLIRKNASFVSMDFSDQGDDAYFERCCPYLDCAEISCGDMEEDAIREMMEKLFGFGVKQIVIATRGAKGALVRVGDKTYEQAPYLVRALDTMGAGDSFIASFLYRYLEGRNDAHDFPEGAGDAGTTKGEVYLDMLVRLSLYRAAVFSAAQCQRDGSFGFGREVELTDEDLALMQ